MNSETKPILHGCYINLRESRGRDAAMQAHLQSLGLQSDYPRFEAVRGLDLPERAQTHLAAGHLGCWFSHRALWERAAALPAGQALHILEDDARLHAHCRPLVLKMCQTRADWDLLYTDVFWHPPPQPVQFASLLRGVKDYRASRKLSLAPLRGWRFTGTTSYVVRPHGAQRLLERLDGRWREGRSFDVLIDDLVQQGALRAMVIVPFASTLAEESEQSTTGDEGPALEVIRAMRRALYMQADPEAIRTQVLGAKADASVDPLLDLYLAQIRETFRSIQLDGVEARPGVEPS